MKKLILIMFMLLFATVALASNNLTGIQGFLDHSNGSAVTGTKEINVSIINSEGNVVWNETKTVYVSGGLFDTVLGNTTSLTTEKIEGASNWSVTVEDEAPQTRPPILKVLFSYISDLAKKVMWFNVDGLNNDTIIRAGNSSWLWRNITNGTLLYDYNKTWLTSENNPTNSTIHADQLTNIQKAVQQNENNPINSTIYIPSNQVDGFGNDSIVRANNLSEYLKNQTDLFTLNIYVGDTSPTGGAILDGNDLWVAGNIYGGGNLTVFGNQTVANINTTVFQANVTMIGSSVTGFWVNISNGNVNLTNNIMVHSLSNCDTINTTPEGKLICGNDKDTFNSTSEIWANAINSTFIFVHNKTDLFNFVNNGSFLVRGIDKTILNYTNVNLSLVNGVAGSSFSLGCGNVTGAAYNVCVGDGSKWAVDNVTLITSGDTILVINQTWLNETIQDQAAVANETIIRKENTTWITSNQDYNSSQEFWDKVLNSTIIYVHNSTWVFKSLNASVIMEYNTTWITRNQLSNTSIDIIKVVNGTAGPANWNGSTIQNLLCSQIIFNNGMGSSGICDGDDGAGGGGAGDKWIDEGDYISPNGTYAFIVNASEYRINGVSIEGMFLKTSSNCSVQGACSNIYRGASEIDSIYLKTAGNCSGVSCDLIDSSLTSCAKVFTDGTGNLVCGTVTGNTSIIIDWTQLRNMSNDTIIRAGNLSWLLRNIWNTTNATIYIPSSHVTDFENGSIIRNMNTSWIILNENNPTNATIDFPDQPFNASIYINWTNVNGLRNDTIVRDVNMTVYLKTSSNCSVSGACSNIYKNTDEISALFLGINNSPKNTTIFINWTHVINLSNDTIIREGNDSWIWSKLNSSIIYDYNLSKIMGDNPTNDTIHKLVNDSAARLLNITVGNVTIQENLVFKTNVTMTNGTENWVWLMDPTKTQYKNIKGWGSLWTTFIERSPNAKNIPAYPETHNYDVFNTTSGYWTFTMNNDSYNGLKFVVNSTVFQSKGLDMDIIKVLASDGSQLMRVTETSGGFGWFGLRDSAGNEDVIFRTDGGANYIKNGDLFLPGINLSRGGGINLSGALWVKNGTTLIGNVSLLGVVSSCASLKTDASGYIICGPDSGASSGDMPTNSTIYVNSSSWNRTNSDSKVQLAYQTDLVNITSLNLEVMNESENALRIHRFNISEDQNVSALAEIEWSGGEYKFGNWRNYFNDAENSWTLSYNAPYYYKNNSWGGRDQGAANLASIASYMRFDVAEGASGLNNFEINFAAPGDTGTYVDWDLSSKYIFYDGYWGGMPAKFEIWGSQQMDAMITLKGHQTLGGDADTDIVSDGVNHRFYIQSNNTADYYFAANSQTGQVGIGYINPSHLLTIGFNATNISSSGQINTSSLGVKDSMSVSTRINLSSAGNLSASGRSKLNGFVFERVNSTDGLIWFEG